MKNALPKWSLVAVPALAAVLGHLGGGAAARAHRTVSLAREVRAEEAGLVKTRSLELDAYHAAHTPQPVLFAEARALERRFRSGGALFGAWCGLVVAVKVWSLGRRTRRREYEAEAGHCLACGRCYICCPRERLRLKRLHPSGEPGAHV